MLAVIVILAIIALIAVPVILNIIDKANKSSFKDTAYGIIQAGEYYYAGSQLDLEGPLEDVTMATSDSRLELKGDIPEGTVKITKDGKIELAVKNNRYCVTKGLEDIDITITENPEDCKLPSVVSGITLNTESVSVINGGTYQIEATVTPDTALNKTLTYTSNNEAIATVSNNGLITGISGGTTTILVRTTDGSNISKTVEVIVRQQVTSLELSTDSVNVDKGKIETVTATILPENAYNKVLNWVSNDETIATVSNGVITGVKAGSTTITVTTSDGSNISKTINVTVNQGQKTLADVMVSTTNDCVTSGTCTPEQIATNEGIKVTINVKEGTPKDFYVIADDGNKVTLIMSENLGDNVAWYDSSSGDNSHGPTTALEELALRTNDWEIPEFTYSLSGIGEDKTTRKYPDSEVTWKARLITYAEANAVGCTTSSCPDWMYDHLDSSYINGYWTSTAYASSSDGVWNVDFYGTLIDNFAASRSNGVRSVIELSK